MERCSILLPIDWASDIELFSSFSKENFFAKMKVVISEFDFEPIQVSKFEAYP